MKSFLISVLIMLSFLANAFAESSCTCVDETKTHESHEIEKHADYEDHKDNQTEEQHCSHVCAQCHFVALNLPVFFFTSTASSFKVSFLNPIENLRSVSQSLYRPPIL